MHAVDVDVDANLNGFGNIQMRSECVSHSTTNRVFKSQTFNGLLMWQQHLSDPLCVCVCVCVSIIYVSI